MKRIQYFYRLLGFFRCNHLGTESTLLDRNDIIDIIIAYIE